MLSVRGGGGQAAGGVCVGLCVYVCVCVCVVVKGVCAECVCGGGGIIKLQVAGWLAGWLAFLSPNSRLESAGRAGVCLTAGPAGVCLTAGRAGVWLTAGRAGVWLTAGRAGVCLTAGRPGVCLTAGSAGVCHGLVPLPTPSLCSAYITVPLNVLHYPVQGTPGFTCFFGQQCPAS